MVPSPRKRAPSTFIQTWHETDATTFDPASLPVSKARRAWERKQEKRVTREGKEKKVWRRYTTRSSAVDSENQETEHDVRSRPVKRRQQVRPAEMELLATAPKAKKRAFKATQWDRRRSVLPRKKRSIKESSNEQGTAIENIEQEGAENDASNTIEAGSASLTRWDDSESQSAEQMVPSILKGDRRRSDFTFSAQTCNEIALDDALCDDRIQDPVSPTRDQDAIAASVLSLSTSEETIALPSHCDTMDGEEQRQCPGDDQVALDFDAGSAEHSSVEETQYAQEEASAPQAQCNIPDDLQASSSDIFEVIQEPESDHLVDLPSTEDADMSDSSSEIEIFSPVQVNGAEQDDNQGSAGPADEDFTEASIQLEIQREMDINGSEPDIVESVETIRTSPSLSTESARQDVMELEISLDEAQELRDVDDNSSDIDPCLSSASEQDVKIEETEAAIADADDFVENTELFHGQSSTQASEIAQDASSIGQPQLFDDITAGLTLTSSMSIPSSALGRKLRSPSPPPRMQSGPDEPTATMHFDDDTAILKDFLTRAAASKASKAATITRRSSLQNRRDSDVVRQALASPRQILEDKDPNSPTKYDNDTTMDLSQTMTLNMDQPLAPTAMQAEANGTDDVPAKSSRRSSRTRTSRLPAPATPAQPAQIPKSISVRRADGGEPIVLKKTEAQEIGLLTRSNTRKNKQGAVSVSLKLLKLSTEAAKLANQDSTAKSGLSDSFKAGKKNVRWDETLAYYQDGTTTLANAIAEAQSLATPDELSLSISTPSSKKKLKQKEPKEKVETPRVRRVRGLGAANGTPGKGLLEPASLLPEGVMDEKEAAVSKPQRLPKASRLKKMVVSSASTASAPETECPPMELEPVGVDQSKESKPTMERKSRLASPRKVKLPQPSAPGEGKENQQQSRRIGGATPKKGLKLPEVVVPPVVESALPRRRPVRKA